MKKAAFYPVTPWNQFVFEYRDLIKGEFQVTAAVVPNAYKKSVSISEHEIYSHVQDVLNKVDAVIFVPFWDKSRLLQDMRTVMDAGKDVVSFIDLSDEEAETLRTYAEEHTASFSTITDNRLVNLMNSREDPFLQPESIVIAVSSITKGIHNSALVAGLASALMKKGYHVGAVCSDPTLSILEGFAYLPIDRLISSNLDNCIMKINEFFFLYQMKYKPDIIIVQLPDEGICRLSYEMASCFGARTYLYSQAIDFDYGIVLSPIISADAQLYSGLNENFQNRFGLPINSVCIAAKETKLEMAHGEENVKYYRAFIDETNSVVDSLRAQDTDIMYYSVSEDYSDALAEAIIEHLS